MAADSAHPLPGGGPLHPTLPALTIDVWADIACPWCWIGERRLRSALRQRPGLETDLRWRPFLLQPDLPEQGMEWEEFVRERFGGEERAFPAFQQVQDSGAREGLAFRFDRMTRAPLTRDAHRLIRAGRQTGVDWRVAEALFFAHFTEGRNLNNAEDLLQAAARGGLDEEEGRRILEGSAGMKELEEERREARRLGITGVPFLVVGNRYAVSGAHPPDVILQTIDATLRELVLRS